ncbi:cyclodeaminase/cyclohydrolase family protein [Paenibacillus senegalensis]|uniref:cyclodeaminase/cyclohydrolase family protein n=1 Tax=Paenibacillus senegalensis TaxID=1465766 RepID=UPI0002893B38|nr:cyclodeaminase/cyclohydrolase family protein [Paenibacillus senegalensis]
MSGFNQTLTSFLKEASSASPTPGGGSVAAVAAALGASMGSMVANLTTGEKFKEVADQMVHVAEEMEAAISEFEQIFVKDIEAFAEYMQALSLPKATEEEKSLRSTALRKAARQAADVPFRLMKLGHGLMAALDRIAAKANRNVLSDLGIAAIMVDAAVQSAWLTVKINLPAVKEEETVRRYQEEGSRLLQEIADWKGSILQQQAE